MWFEMMFSDTGLTCWLLLAAGSVLWVIISIAPPKVILCCILVQYALYKACSRVHTIFRSKGLAQFLSPGTNRALTDDSMFDYFYQLVVSGNVPFYFSRLCILMWVKPTDDELVSILRGCNASFINWMLRKGLINHLPRGIRVMYRPHSGALNECNGSSDDNQASAPRALISPICGNSQALEETYTPQGNDALHDSLISETALRNLLQSNLSDGDTAQPRPIREQRAGESNLTQSEECVSLIQVCPDDMANRHGRKLPCCRADDTSALDVNLPAVTRGNFLLPLVTRLVVSRLFDGNNIAMETLAVAQFRAFAVCVAATAIFLLLRSKTRRQMRNRTFFGISGVGVIVYCWMRLQRGKDKNTTRQRLGNQKSRTAARHDNLHFRIRRERMKELLRSQLNNSLCDHSHTQPCATTISADRPIMGFNNQTALIIDDEVNAPIDHTSHDQAMGNRCASGSTARHSWIRWSQRELHMSAEVLSRFVDRHFVSSIRS
eukprot:Selendium_serpulae@DN2198_c0_g1_i1.p1